ncbi:hypothetical protein GQ54DRAFT_69493 [Martensiomyces pterosporus]|nr:hypothetical protein GQ54DRAFT_69493 [Martensiomyces pterosporus]
MTTPLVFDEARYAALASPGDREMFLLKWLSSLDAYLESTATGDALKGTQEKLEQILLEIAMIPPAIHAKPGSRLSWLGGGNSGSGTSKAAGSASVKPGILTQVPKPARVVRDLIAKCLTRLYEIGDMRRLGETLDAIQAVMQAKKKTVEREARLAALVCAGVLFEALSTKAGFRLLSCFNDFLAIALKTIKTSAEPVSVRVEATRTLSKLLQGGGGKTAAEAQAKEIIKCIRPNLQHKSPLLVLATISALESLVFFTPYMLPASSFDAESFISSALLDLLSSTVLIIRRAAARFIAVLISNTISLSSTVSETNSGGANGGELIASSKVADPAIRAIAKSAGYQLKAASAGTSVRNSFDEQHAKGHSASPEATLPAASPATSAISDGKSRPRRETISMTRGDSHPEDAQGLHSTRSSNDISAQGKVSPVGAATVVNAANSSNAGASAAVVRAEASASNDGSVSLARALTWLSVPFTRAAASRELRAGIIDAYAALFEELGTKVVESHYALILNHILIDLASSAQIPGSTALDSRTRAVRPGLTHAIGTPSNLPTSAFSSRLVGSGSEQQVDNGTGLVGALDARAEADILALRNMCSWLLRVPIAQKLLTEQGKLGAAQTIWNAWLAGSLPADVRAMVEGNSQQNSMTNLAAAAAGAVLPWRSPQSTTNSAAGGGGSEVALLIVLQEWRLLIEDLGETCGSLDVFLPIPTGDDGEERGSSYYSDVRKNTWMVPLENWLGYPNEAVRINAAACLGSLMRHDRSHTSRVVATLVSRFQQFCAHCAAHSSPTLDAMKRCIGYAYGIASVIAMGAAANKGGVSSVSQPSSFSSGSSAQAVSPASESLLDVPLDLVEWVHSIAIRLLNSAYQRTEPEIIESKHQPNSAGSERVVAGASSADPANVGASLGMAPAAMDRTQDRQRKPAVRADRLAALLNMRMTAGWVLLTGLTSLGPEFISKRAHTEWLRLWIAAMPQPDDTSSSGFVTADMPWYTRSHQLQSRYMALSHFLAYMRTTAADTAGTSCLADSEVKRILACLRFTLMFADNALDAPPPPLPQSTGRASGGGARRASVSVQAYDVVDPARPTWELPTQTSILTSHMQIRDRVVECLQVFTHPAKMSSMTPAITRLIEQVLASADNLLEIHGTKIGAAVLGASSQLSHKKDASPRPNSQRLQHGPLGTVPGGGLDPSMPGGVPGAGSEGYTCLRGFRSGPWGYESETGVTTLLHSIVGQSDGAQKLSSDRQSLGSMASSTSAGKDFANCHMSAPEFDWLATLCPTASMFLGTQPISAAEHREIAASGANRIALTLQPPPAPYTKLVDDSIQLFGHIFPSLSDNAQMTLLDDLVMRLNSLPFNSHRYAAVLTNILSALYAAIQGYSLVRQGLLVIEHQSDRSPNQQQQLEIAPRVARAVVEMTRAALILPSPAHRLLAGEIIGYLATFTRDASTAYLPYLLDHLTSQAIRSRDRFARAGTAVALGSLYSRAGSIVAGGSLKQVVVLLHSLASDKDPIVHTWAISALAEAAMSAGFMFEPYARDTFKMALKLFLSDSHAFPLYASALWIRGREHAAHAITDCASIERALPLRSMIDPAAWSRQAAQQFAANETANSADASRFGGGLGNIVAVAKDAAITHPNSTTHHGRSSEEQRDAALAAAVGGEGDYQYVCARSDMDAFDARASIGHLVSSLILVFGPELQVDDVTRDSVLTLLRELRRSLPSVGAPVPLLSGQGAPLSPIVDPDARWQTAAEFIFATQKQLLFFPPREPEFLPLLVRQTLRPILQTRRTAYYGYSAGLHSFQHVSVLALDGVLRLYGERIVESLEEHSEADWADWSMSDIVWEALALHNTVCEQRDIAGGDCDSPALIADLRKLVRSTINLAVGHEYSKLESLCALTEVQFDEAGENAEGIAQTVALVETLCLVFTKRAGAVASLGGSKAKNAVQAEDVLVDNVRPFNSITKQVAVVAVIAILDVIDCARPPASALSLGRGRRQWRSHPFTSLLADLVRVGYMAATSPVSQSPTLCCLGLHLLQRLIDQFCDVEDPAMPGEGMPILSIYQAQLNSAFMPALSETPGTADAAESSAHGTSGYSGHPPLLKQAAMNAATAYLVSGLVTDRGSLVRILRLLAPQVAFRSMSPGAPGAKHRFNAKNDPLDTITPQTHIITRLTTLRTWSVILDYAIKARSEGLLDVVKLHMPVLCELWLDAVRDTAVVGVQSRDIYDELHIIEHAAASGVARSAGRGADGSSDDGAPDIGLGLNLGLESTYVELVRGSLAVWYRYYLPRFLGSLSLLLSTSAHGGAAKGASVLRAGHEELLGCLQSTDAVRIPNARLSSGERLPSQSAVLLLSFILQELARLSKLSSADKFVSQLSSADLAGDPLVTPTVSRLLGALDIDGTDQGSQGDSEAERIASLVRAGVSVYGPTSSTSNAAVRWSSDIDLLSSLLSALCALLELSGDLHFASLFVATANADSVSGEGGRSWLVEEIWMQAVTTPLQPLVSSTELDGGDAAQRESGRLSQAAKQQCENRNARIDVATKAMAVSKALLGSLGTTATRTGSTGDVSQQTQPLAKWLFDSVKFNAALSRDSPGDSPIFDSLGLSDFGYAVLRDAIGAWRFARCCLLRSATSSPNDDDEQLVSKLCVLASDSLHMLAVIVGAALSRYDPSANGDLFKSLVALWLDLWRESVFKFGATKAAFAVLNEFLQTGGINAPAAAAAAVPADLLLNGGSLTGDDNDNCGAPELLSSMLNSMLAELLASEDEDVLVKALSLVASILKGAEDTTPEPLSAKVRSLFVAKLASMLASSSNSGVPDVPGFMAAANGTSFVANSAVLSVLPALARESIPAIAKALYQQIENEKPAAGGDSALLPAVDSNKLLNVLVMFATTSYADSMVGGSMMAAVLMLLLSMLPDDCSNLLAVETRITEAILSLAALSPDLFKSILIRLSSTQPLAKRRLESAIRSRASSAQRQQQRSTDENGEDDDDGGFGDAGRRSSSASPPLQKEGESGAGKISLKSNFAGF